MLAITSTSGRSHRSWQRRQRYKGNPSRSLLCPCHLVATRSDPALTIGFDREAAILARRKLNANPANCLGVVRWRLMASTISPYAHC